MSLFVTSALCAGDFSLKERDYSGYWIEYTGVVDRYDNLKLRTLMELIPSHTNVYCTINSPGGSAYGGIALYYEAEKWDNLITIAGADFGAWSAAAIFWLGSPRDFTIPGSQVGFHAAYCNSWAPPGCDTTSFQNLFKDILYREGFEEGRFNATLNYLQATYGVDAWLIKTSTGWNLTVRGMYIKELDIPQGPRPITKDRI